MKKKLLGMILAVSVATAVAGCGNETENVAEVEIESVDVVEDNSNETTENTQDNEEEQETEAVAEETEKTPEELYSAEYVRTLVDPNKNAFVYHSTMVDYPWYSTYMNDGDDFCFKDEITLPADVINSKYLNSEGGLKVVKENVDQIKADGQLVESVAIYKIGDMLYEVVTANGKSEYSKCKYDAAAFESSSLGYILISKNSIAEISGCEKVKYLRTEEKDGRSVDIIAIAEESSGVTIEVDSETQKLLNETITTTDNIFYNDVIESDFSLPAECSDAVDTDLDNIIYVYNCFLNATVSDYL